MKQIEINNIQQAIACIHAVGEDHESQVLDTLKSLTWGEAENEIEIKFQETIDNIASEYALKTANRLWIECYEEIPNYIKEWKY